MNTQENIQQLLGIISRKERKQLFKQIFSIVLKSFLVFCVLFGLVFVLNNFYGLDAKISYFWRYKILAEPQPKKKTVAKYFLPTAKEKTQTILPEAEDNLLIIPRIEIKAPIIWDSPWEGKKMLQNLRMGVIHLSGTAKPDEIGNVVIAGHSSTPIWDKNNRFGKIFANLDELKIGDLIELHFNRQAYFYEVKKVFQVEKDEVWVTQKTEVPTLTLITCTPIGTAQKRLIVQAQIVGERKPTKIQSTKKHSSLLPRL